LLFGMPASLTIGRSGATPAGETVSTPEPEPSS
jgi:hypothetical protein